MDDSNLNNNIDNSNNTYRATTNLNVALENLDADNINSATGINIQGTDYSDSGSYANQNLTTYSNLQGNDVNLQNSMTFVDANNVQTLKNNSYEFVSNNNVGQENYLHGEFDGTNGNKFINNSLNNDSVNTFIVGNNEINPQFITNNNADVYMGGDAVTAVEKKKVVYEPILESKKKPIREQDSKMAKEGITVIIFALILVIFVLFLPDIYDFFREVKLAFVNR